jgi:hypothetical protein
MAGVVTLIHEPTLSQRSAVQGDLRLRTTEQRALSIHNLCVRRSPGRSIGCAALVGRKLIIWNKTSAPPGIQQNPDYGNEHCHQENAAD